MQRELAPLLGTFANITVIGHGEVLPPFDLQCPLMSLPLALRTALDTIPADVPYIAPPAAEAQAWGTRLRGPKPLIGLAWAGDPLHKNDANRSMRLCALRPLLDLPGLQFVSLQHEIAAEDAQALRTHPQRLTICGPFRDFAQTAAVIAGLDAVVAVDTAVAHLAGALGKPLCVLLPFGADFRWLRERCDSPWYPSARLFRQRAFNGWSGAVEALRRHLESMFSHPQSEARLEKRAF